MKNYWKPEEEEFLKNNQSIWDDSTFYYNSQGEPVATFKLKQWK